MRGAWTIGGRVPIPEKQKCFKTYRRIWNVWAVDLYGILSFNYVAVAMLAAWL